MFKQVKKRQHYVWRRYLKSWCLNNKISCMRNGMQIFSTDLMGVGQQNYFYEVNELTSEDINYVKSLFLGDVSDEILAFYDRLFALFSMVEALEQSARRDEVFVALKKNYAKNLEEEIQSEIELQGESCLQSLLDGKIDFFESDQGAAHFINYICMQYLRTKKQQESIVNGFTGLHKDQIVKCINLIRIVFSIKLSTNIFVNRRKYKLILVDNVSEVKFVTCDQPVINFMAVNTPEGQQASEFGLYYPISPICAVFLVERDVFGASKRMTFNEELVNKFNVMMLQSAYEQVYATSEEQLRCLLINAT